MKFVQVTDLHIVPAGGKLLELNPVESPMPYEHGPSAYGIVHVDAEQTTVHTKLMI